jgi:hypothetical protein
MQVQADLFYSLNDYVITLLGTAMVPNESLLARFIYFIIYPEVNHHI